MAVEAIDRDEGKKDIVEGGIVPRGKKVIKQIEKLWSTNRSLVIYDRYLPTSLRSKSILLTWMGLFFKSVANLNNGLSRRR